VGGVSNREPVFFCRFYPRLSARGRWKTNCRLVSDDKRSAIAHPLTGLGPRSGDMAGRWNRTASLPPGLAGRRQPSLPLERGRSVGRSWAKRARRTVGRGRTGHPLLGGDQARAVLCAEGLLEGVGRKMKPEIPFVAIFFCPFFLPMNLADLPPDLPIGTHQEEYMMTGDSLTLDRFSSADFSRVSSLAMRSRLASGWWRRTDYSPVEYRPPICDTKSTGLGWL